MNITITYTIGYNNQQQQWGWSGEFLSCVFGGERYRRPWTASLQRRVKCKQHHARYESCTVVQTVSNGVTQMKKNGPKQARASLAGADYPAWG